MAIKLFFSYAHEDEPLLDDLKSQLRPLQRQGLIDIWHDRDISAGSEWAVLDNWIIRSENRGFENNSPSKPSYL